MAESILDEKSTCTDRNQRCSMKRNTTTPATITTQQGRLSFVTVTRTKRGRWVSQNYFDVVPETYMNGVLTGKRMALEMMLDLKAHPEDYKGVYSLNFIISDVMLAQAEAKAIRNRVLDTPTREGAASGFMQVMTQYFAFGVRQAEIKNHMASEIEQQIKSNEKMDLYDAKRKAVATAQRLATRLANKALQTASA